MILWLDEHLSPQLAVWITPTFGFEAVRIRDLGLARAKDREVFRAEAEAVEGAHSCAAKKFISRFQAFAPLPPRPLTCHGRA